MDDSEPVKATVAAVKPGTTLPKGQTKGSTTFTANVSPLNQYNVVRVVDDSNETLRAGPISVLAPTGPSSVQSMYTLGMAGIDLTSTTTTTPSQQYFAEFDLTAPVRCTPKGGTIPRAVDNRCWLWFNPRIASIPSPSTTPLSSLTSADAALSGLGQLTLGQMTQTLELNGGFEFAFLKPSQGIFWGRKPRAVTSLSFILGAGMVSPFNSENNPPAQFDLTNPGTATCGTTLTLAMGSANDTCVFQQFKNDSALQGTYPQLYNTLKACTMDATSTPTPPTCPQHVAFSLPDRSRFYRRYFVGFRVKTFFFDEGEGKCTRDSFKNCKSAGIFPGSLDLTFGQDETVTRGIPRGIVTTLSADYPFPGYPSLRIFGAAYLRMHGNVRIPTLALVPSAMPVALNDPTIFIQSVQPGDQDYFRIGFGFDIVQAFKSITKSGNAPATTTPSGGSTTTASSAK